MIRRPPRSTRVRSSAASDVYKRRPSTSKTSRGDDDTGVGAANVSGRAAAGGAAAAWRAACAGGTAGKARWDEGGGTGTASGATGARTSVAESAGVAAPAAGGSDPRDELQG